MLSKSLLPHLLPVWACLMGLLPVSLADDNGNWTVWSDWSACSRTCDGGASYQLRRCLSRCDGENIRYRTCNNQACPEGSADFRQQQCAAYNDVPFHGKLYQWEAQENPRDPCALRCRPKGHNVSVVLAPKVLDGTRCNRNSNAMCINGVCRAMGCDNVLGSGTVLDRCGVCGGDGTSCSVGQLPPTLRSQRAHFSWKLQDTWSGCSVSCGVGVQKSMVICFDQHRNVKVSDDLCDAKKMPPSFSRECQMPRCGPGWITGEWQSCSKSCGGGISRRHLYCVEEVGDGSFRRFYDSYCKGPRPATSRPCNGQQCPIWYAGQFSPCSVTCGLGVQKRDVICRKSTRMTCSDHDKPKTSLQCYMGPCIGQKAPAELKGKLQQSGSDELLQHGQEMTFKPLVDKNGQKDPTADDYSMSTTSIPHIKATEMQKLPDTHGQSESKAIDISHSIQKPWEIGLSTPKASGYFSSTPEPHQRVQIIFEKAPEHELTEMEDTYQSLELKPLPIPDIPDHVFQLAADGAQLSVIELKDIEDYAASGTEDYDLESFTDGTKEVDPEISTTPSFKAEPWSRCSATCGQGTRSRRVLCKVYLEFSRSVEILDDRACIEQKPPTTEHCYETDCNMATGREEIYFAPNPLAGEYLWKLQGFSQCSASCLGGRQRTTHRCSRAADGLIVDDSRCQGVQRPPTVERPCNVISCPPYWRSGSYGPCSAPCGGGSQRRYVECVREYAVNQVEVLQDSDCTEPTPPRNLLCNPIDCPPTWDVNSWSQCSVTCGEGVEQRDVICQQIINPGKIRVVEGALCETSAGPKPSHRRPCQQPACPSSVQTGLIKEVDFARTVQMRPRRKMTVLVGGEAVLIPGTTLQVRCPIDKGISSQWFRETGAEAIGRKGRIRVTKHGMLNIKKSREKDQGVYQCVVQSSQANISITFHSADKAQAHYHARLQFLSEFVMSEAGQSLSVPAHSPSDDNALRGHDRPLILSMIETGNSEGRDVPPLFFTGEWSRCSSTCGGAGLQTRNITCELIMEDYYKQVELEHCALSGMEMPLEAKDCGFEKCPHWEFGQWGQCSNDRCSRFQTGTRERPAYCVAHNNSQVHPGACEPLTDNHLYIQECRHDDCEAIWKTLHWTKCSRSCGEPGVKTRVIQCVWRNNNKPAATNCDKLERPFNVQECQLPPCSPQVCQDESKYCDLAKMLKLCRYKIYRVQCCRTCKKRRKRQRRRRQRT